MRRLLDLIDIDSVARAIRSELAELFPGTRFQVEAKRGPFSGYVSVKWTDGPALTRVQETRIRERYDLIIVDDSTGERINAGKLFVRNERERPEDNLEKTKRFEGVDVDGLNEIIVTLCDELKDYTRLRDMILFDERTGSKARTGSLFIRYEREYSEKALETVRCTSPYLSYDYALLAETDFPERP